MESTELMRWYPRGSGRSDIRIPGEHWVLRIICSDDNFDETNAMFALNVQEFHMKATFTLFVAAALVAVAPMHAEDNAGLNKRLASATAVVREIEGTPDGGIPDFIVSKANCIAVIPSVKKAAFVVGASYGQGVVTCRTSKGWSAPVFIRLEGWSARLDLYQLRS